MEKNNKEDLLKAENETDKLPVGEPPQDAKQLIENTESKHKRGKSVANFLGISPSFGKSCPKQSIANMRSTRKRKLSKDVSFVKDSKKRKRNTRRKSFEKNIKLLAKKVGKKYLSESRSSHKSRSTKRPTTSSKRPEVPQKKKDDRNRAEKMFKEEYNKRLDCLARYGKNFYCPCLKQMSGLRPIYIDGSNVAYCHGQNERFSVKGLKICIDYFRRRHHEVKAFVPHFRLRRGESTDQELLHKLVNKKLVITTPTLYIQNKRRSPYDDWYIVQSAAANGGIIVSADNFQDIIKWNPNLRSVIEECRLVPTFVDDMLIFPVDPHGNRQNNLEEFLKF